MRGQAAGERSGFTLLELMFALTILSVGVMAAFSGQMNSMSLISSSDETRLAVMDLSAAMETLIARGPDQCVATYPAGQPLDTYDSLHLIDQAIVPSYPGYAGGPVPDVLQVELVCTWTDFEGRTRSLDLASAIVR